MTRPNVRLSRILPAVMLFITACGGSPENEPVYGEESEALTMCPGPNIVTGIDVSSWQGTIDWDKVKATNHQFAIARVSYATSVDSKFDYNWREMKRVGMIRGVYQYFEPNIDPVAQANVLLRKVPKLEPGDLPAVLDVESTGGGRSPAQISAAIRAWIATVKAAHGRDPIIYTGKYFWDDNVKSSEFSTLLLWLANYSSNCPILPSPWKAWKLHQHSSTGRVSGITGNVDLNKFDGTRADLQELAGIPRCTAACDGDVLVAASCERIDCSVGGSCVSDTFGPRCVNSACPATGTAKVCATATRMGDCSNGAVVATAACPDASYCTATTADGAPTCVSAFCVPNSTERPVPHDDCFIERDVVAHCDAAGALSLERCPQGELCVTSGEKAHCGAPLCPADGSPALACVDANTLGRCAGGDIVDTVDCVTLGGRCTSAGGQAPHCASTICVASPSVVPEAHTACTEEGKLATCDAQGLVVELEACPAGMECVTSDDGFGECVSPGAGGDVGCGCTGGASEDAMLLLPALLLVRRRQAKKTRATS